MVRLKDIGLAILVIIMLLLPASLRAQTAAKKPLPQVPITYQSDTDEAIKRRAQWIEGAKKEGELDWWGILNPGDAAKVIVEFNKIYPFVKVNYWRGRGEEVGAKLEAVTGGGRVTVDIALGGEPYNYPRWRKMGMLEKFIDIIPELKRLDKRTYGRDGDWAQPGNNGGAPAYNTNKVSAAEAPKTWEDLLDPKWKGQIALPPDVRAWITLALEEGGWGIEKTESYLNRLREQQIIWAPSYAAGHSLLVSGEFKIYGQSYIYNTLQAKDKRLPVEWSRVKPVIVTGPSITLQKKAPHPSAARLFLEWVFSPRGLVTYDRITYYGAAFPGAGTQLSKALEGSPVIYRTEEGEIKAVELGLGDKFAKLLGIRPD